MFECMAFLCVSVTHPCTKYRWDLFPQRQQSVSHQPTKLMACQQHTYIVKLSAQKTSCTINSLLTLTDTNIPILQMTCYKSNAGHVCQTKNPMTCQTLHRTT